MGRDKQTWKEKEPTTSGSDLHFLQAESQDFISFHILGGEWGGKHTHRVGKGENERGKRKSEKEGWRMGEGITHKDDIPFPEKKSGCQMHHKKIICNLIKMLS